MKKYILLSLVLLCYLPSHAQKIRVSESTEKIGGGSHNALVVSIYGASTRDIEHKWKSLMKHYNAKVSMKKEMFADNAVIKDMGDNTIDIYARDEEEKNGEVKFIVGFDLGGAYLSSSGQPAKYKVAKKILHDFATELTKDALEEKLKDQKKQLDKLNSTYSDLQHQNKKLNNEIQDYKDRIKSDQDDIEKNKDAEAQKQKEIATQQQVVDDLSKKVKDVE